jgi:hypothetical protein
MAILQNRKKDKSNGLAVGHKLSASVYLDIGADAASIQDRKTNRGYSNAIWRLTGRNICQ